MLLKDVVGQAGAKAGFKTMVQSGRLPHALLLSGREGTGGLPLALAFAQYLLCASPDKSTDACGSCPACQKVARLEHADLHLSFPSVKANKTDDPLSKNWMAEFREFALQSPYGSGFEWLKYINAENKQGNISADECRDIIEQLNLKSYEGGWKIQIIWGAEKTDKAGNILLKLIEEPPPQTLLLLISEEPEELLATIRSRTQSIPLLPLTVPEIAEALVARGTVQLPDAALQIALLSDGSYARALHLVQHLADTDFLQELRRWFIALFQKDGLGITRFAEDWAKGGREHQKNFLGYVQAMMGHALRAGYLKTEIQYLPQGDAAFIQRLVEKQLSPDAYAAISNHLSETFSFIEGNANAKVQMVALSLQLQRAMQAH